MRSSCALCLNHPKALLICATKQKKIWMKHLEHIKICLNHPKALLISASYENNDNFAVQ